MNGDPCLEQAKRTIFRWGDVKKYGKHLTIIQILKGASRVKGEGTT